jgi:cell division protein YceG involved in septum cleavage
MSFTSAELLQKTESLVEGTALYDRYKQVGITHYAATLQEHNQNIRKYLK